jgi:peptide chain release factor 1
MSSSRLTHIPTGIVATAQTRSRENSFTIAQENLLAKLNEYYGNAHRQQESIERKEQIGSGMRGDKIRTYRFQDDVVKDHQTNKTASVARVLSGNFNLLW